MSRLVRDVVLHAAACSHSCDGACGDLLLFAADLHLSCLSPQSLDGVMGRLLEVREVLVEKNKGVNYINLDEVRTSTSTGPLYAQDGRSQKPQ